MSSVLPPDDFLQIQSAEDHLGEILEAWADEHKSIGTCTLSMILLNEGIDYTIHTHGDAMVMNTIKQVLDARED